MGQGEKRSVSTRMRRCGVKGMVGGQDIHPSNTCLPLTVGVALGRMVGMAWVAGRQAGGDLINIWKTKFMEAGIWLWESGCAALSGGGWI